MPGIFGLVTDLPPEQARGELARMANTMRLPSSTRVEIWADEACGAYVGWTELKASSLSNMPVVNQAEDCLLIFSGEEYSSAGQIVQQSSNRNTPDRHPASYLLTAYERANRFPASLNGLFHGIVIDRRDGTVLLFNDRYGMHRLYYHQAPHGFYFAGQAKALLAACPHLRTIDPQGLAELVSFGCVLEDRTLFGQIHTLPAASAWTFRNKRLETKSNYFHPSEWENQPTLTAEEYYQELREALSRSLPRYFTGAESVAIALTGGLDTRLIMAWRKPAPGTLPCYTFGSMFRDTEDVRVARQVASLCGQEHHAIVIGSTFLANFASYAERTVHFTDGSLDVGRAPDLYVSELARTIAPVKIVGTYGSEMLTDVAAFRPVPLQPGLFSPLTQLIQQANDTYAAARVGHPVTFAAFRQSPWWHNGILSLEQSQLTVRSPYLDADFMRAVYRAPLSPAFNRDVRLRLIADGDSALAQLPTDRGVGGNGGVLSPTIRRAWLRFTLKAEYAYDYGMPAWLAQLDHQLQPLRPERLFLGHHRTAHFRVWYRNELASYVRAILLDRRTLSRPFLNPRQVEAVVEGHTTGKRNFTREIHKLLSIELVYRLFVDTP